MKKESLKKLILSICFIIYLIISFYLMINHEIWTDEAQAWEIAKNLSLPEIINQMKYEGHSCFWHLILAIPSKLGLPIISMNFISWLLTSISVFIILFYSKFNLLIKILIILNPTFIYYNSAIARCYCLILPLLSILMIIYDKRHKHPIIYTNILGLLAHTHIIMCGFVGIASILFLIELLKEKKYKQTILPFIILLIYLILLAIQIVPSFEYSAFLQDKTLKISNVLATTEFFFPLSLTNYYPILLTIILITSLLITTLNNKKRGLIYLIFLLIFYFIQLQWPFVLFERISVIFVIIIMLNFNVKNIITNLLIGILSITIMIANKHMIIRDATADYSDSEKAASFINENIEENSLIFIPDISRHVSIAAQTKKEIDYYNYPNQSFQTYITWSKEAFEIAKDTMNIESQLLNLSKTYRNTYILLSFNKNASINFDSPIINYLSKKYKLINIYETKLDSRSIEHFIIYELK